MEGYSDITIILLTPLTVSLKFTDANQNKEILSFSNDENGRLELLSLLGEDNIFYKSIIMLWGDTPLSQSEDQNLINSAVLSPTARIHNLEDSVVDIQLAIAELYEKMNAEEGK